MTRAMQTSAIESGAPLAAAMYMVEIVGFVTHAAEVRTKIVGDDNHPVPVLGVDLRPASGAKHSIHIEQVFTQASRKSAEAKAVSLKRGSHVVVRTSLTDMRVTFPHVQSVALQEER